MFSKLNLKKLLISVSIFVLIVTLSACGSNYATSDESSEDFAYDRGESMAYTEEMGEYSKAEAPMDANTTGFTGDVGYIKEYEQLIIYNGELYIDVIDINEASNSVKNAILNSNGYLINSNLWENDNSSHARYDFKVPVDGFFSLIDEINEMEIGKVTNQYTSGNDVTEEYYDLDSRLKAKKIYEERLLELFAQATETEDLLNISNDLSRVQEEIEQLEGRQKFLSYHSSNSTLTIEMVQYKDKVAPTASTWEKAVDALKQSVEFLKDLSNSIFVGAFALLPIIILLGIVAVVILIIVRKNIKKNKNRKSPEDDSKDSDIKNLE